MRKGLHLMVYLVSHTPAQTVQVIVTGLLQPVGFHGPGRLPFIAKSNDVKTGV